ncbi:Precorrin-2 oxidase [Citrifermentans bremense]|uniref:precorrin-2 dehydrogenase n=1 Tax=Citrifermentans bremense TaxID=60035 RepID=A0A6S6LVZ5_9BACT|nr:bifunctional precorrin-2 dehydrogenase/sirohydrochlorin ferrochelatase [Citrifermentans bremense]BCG45649.1 Precorrin-2 oxidase [Citrifermentans bremense]
MRYYPINIDLHDQSVVIVGGGKVAARKANRLIAAGARLTVVAPILAPTLAELAKKGALRHLERDYRHGDLAGALLAFAATDNPLLNREVAAEAKERGILVDVVDAPRQSAFTTPAVLEQGDLLITVSTGGASPSLSRQIVAMIEPLFGPEYAEAVSLLGTAREKLLTEKVVNEYNDPVFAELAALDLPALIKNGQRDVIDQILLKLSATGARPGPDGADKKEPS